MVHKVILFRKHRELLKTFIFILNSVFACALTCAHTCSGFGGRKSVSNSLVLELSLFWGAHVNDRSQFWFSAREIQVISESHISFLIPNFRFISCSWLWEHGVMQINRVYSSVALYATTILMIITSISTLLISFPFFSTSSHPHICFQVLSTLLTQNFIYEIFCLIWQSQMPAIFFLKKKLHKEHIFILHIFDIEHLSWFYH